MNDLNTPEGIPPADGRPATSEPPSRRVPWNVRDTWVGVGLMVLTLFGAVVVIAFLPREQPAQIATLLLLELIYLIPVAIVFGWKRIHWRLLGFRPFTWGSLGLGCGLLIGAYSLILIHNLILLNLGIPTQGELIVELIRSLGSPVWIVLAGVILAPLVEEMFFRGFLFPSFRQRYGWVTGVLLSSGLFALAHVDPASLFPTFILGTVLAYVYHRSNSLWPGIILHFLINAFGLCATFASLELEQRYPDLVWQALRFMTGSG